MRTWGFVIDEVARAQRENPPLTAEKEVARLPFCVIGGSKTIYKGSHSCFGMDLIQMVRVRHPAVRHRMYPHGSRIALEVALVPSDIMPLTISTPARNSIEQPIIFHTVLVSIHSG